MSITRQQLKDSRPELLRAMRIAVAIASASRAAVERHAKLGETVATIHNGKIEVLPAATLVRRWRSLDSKRAGRRVPKTK